MAVGGAPAWAKRYARKIIATDTVIVLVAVIGAQLLRFGPAIVELNIPVTRRNDFAIDYSLLSAALIGGWLLALSIYDSRDPKVVGLGPDEYKRVVNATLAAFGTLAIIAYLLRSQIGRGYLLIALPIGLVLLFVSRWAWRKRLHRQRQRHLNTYRTLIVGEREKCAHVARELTRNQFAGFDLLGAVTNTGTPGELLPGIPVVAGFDELIPAVDEYRIDRLVIISTDSISPAQMRQIGWALEARQVDLIVASALTDIAGPRIHSRPVSGLPLIHIEYPAFAGRKQFAKRAFDLLGSSILLLMLSPVFLTLAIIVKVGSPGPAFFLQERVGTGGRRFKMFKFRSMVVDAEDKLLGLLDSADGNEVLFKLKSDPRVTKAGAVLRKYSLDELPQLLNVLRGEMSLVGPRPPLPREVDRYEEWVHRRLLVKPGITGLWQVSGRSDLSWEDSVRLDLYYVENWSMVGDLLILLRTVRTVAISEGAY